MSKLFKGSIFGLGLCSSHVFSCLPLKRSTSDSTRSSSSTHKHNIDNKLGRNLATTVWSFKISSFYILFYFYMCETPSVFKSLTPKGVIGCIWEKGYWTVWKNKMLDPTFVLINTTNNPLYIISTNITSTSVQITLYNEKIKSTKLQFITTRTRIQCI